MKARRIGAILALLGMLTFGALTPAPARADGTQTAIIIGAVLGIYVGFVVIGATLAYGKGPRTLALAPGEPPLNQRPRGNEIRVGSACSRDANGNLTLVCW